MIQQYLTSEFKAQFDSQPHQLKPNMLEKKLLRLYCAPLLHFLKSTLESPAVNGQSPPGNDDPNYGGGAAKGELCDRCASPNARPRRHHSLHRP